MTQHQIVRRALYGLAALAFVHAAPPPCLAAEAAARTITVTGTGEVMAQPDIARVSGGVVSQAGTAQAALADNSARMRQVFDALAGLGIADADMRTSDFSVAPVFQRDPTDPSRDPRIVGYRVANQVVAVVREIGRLGTLLDALVGAGANQINTVELYVADPEPLLDQARQAAVGDAQRKATLLSAAAGARLGPALTIQEAGGARPAPMMMARAEMASAVPIATGRQALTASVTITFALE